MKKELLLLFLGLFISFLLAGQISFTEIPDLPFFEDEGYLRGITWVDVDGDNDLDVSISGSRGSSPNVVNLTAIYLHDGNGGFSSTDLITSMQNDPFGQGWADYDNDGDLDVYFGASWNDNGVNELWRNEGGASFTQVTNSGATPNIPQAYEGTVNWGDYDNDGFADLFLTCWDQIANRLYHNNGDGTFSEITNHALIADLAWTSGGYWGDYDNDRDLDMYVANYFVGASNSGTNDLFRNNGDGTFSKLSTAGEVVTDEQNSRFSNWVDINNDGWLDLFVGNQNDQDKIYYNNRDGTFTAVAHGDSSTTTWSANWGDIDNDGDLDLLTMGNWAIDSKCWRNEGGGVFSDISSSFPNIYPLETSGSPRNAIILVDYNSDGWLDLHIAQPNTLADHLYQNIGDDCKTWLEVECVGVQSNRAAIGATIRAKATINGTPRWQMRQVLAQTAATGHNPLWQHFGFGDATIVDSLVVEWPSGSTCVFENVAVNQLVEIEETCFFQTIVARPLANAGEDVFVDWCEGDDPLDLFFYLGGTPDEGGQWVDVDYNPVSMPVLPIEEEETWYYLADGLCPDTSEVTVFTQPSLTVTINLGDTLVEAGSMLNLMASGAQIYTWEPASALSCANCPNPVFTASETVVLTVIGEDEYGCKDSASTSITVFEKELRFELPNAFTPDNDGINDTFKPLTSGQIFDSFLMYIFNRWGKLVYMSNDPNAGWDGQFNGKYMPSDVYGFYMEYTLTDGVEGTEKGEITLLR